MKSRRNILQPLLRLTGIVGLALKRQRHHRGLTLLALWSIILTVGLVTNASFFAEAVDRVILLQELDDFSRVTGRPPISTSAYVFPSRRNPMGLENAEQVSVHIAGTLSGEVGLPLKQLGVQISSGGLMLQPGPGSDLYAGDKAYLGDVEIIYIAGVAKHIEIVEGTSLDEDGSSDDVLDVWMHQRLVREMGVQIGEILNVGVTLAAKPTPIRLVGFWQARNPQHEFWWYGDPDTALDEALLVRRQDYITFVEPMIPSGSREASWYIILDDEKIVPREAASYLAGFRRGLDIINKYLPGARLNAPPLDPLEDFRQRSTTLTILLLSFNLPAFGILLYFSVLTSAIIARWQRKETSVLVSRGMTLSGVLNMMLVEQLVLSLIGYPLGIGFGIGIARLMGYTASFLSFTGRAPLPVSMEGFSAPLAVLALAVSLLTRLWPAAQSARQSVVAEERERARPMRRPFWYRFYIDIMLLLPTTYAYRLLTARGSLAGLIVDRPEDLYRDPLLILVPALFVLTASLLTMRIFPIAMRVVDAAASMTPWLTIHLALRQLGRRSQDYISPLLLVIVALAMGVYALSMASSLDQWLTDRIYYRTGADLTFIPIPLGGSRNNPVDVGTERIDGGWIPFPADFRSVDGVRESTRVGDFSAHIDMAVGRDVRGRFLAIDRLSFPSVGWFRSDFAGGSLGALMNQLAGGQDSILVSRSFLAAHNLRIGDQLSVLVGIDSTLGLRSSFVIAGVYDYFPTIYEEEKVTLVGDLEYLSTLMGVTAPHGLWLTLEPGVDGQSVLAAIPPTVRVDTDQVQDAQAIIAEEQAKMERVGIFGTLSVGFLAAAVMSILGLLVYSYASLQERVYRLAVLHAVGLSRRQIVVQVILEYAFLAIFGALAGALIGRYASEFFVPFFRFTGEAGTPLPTMLPIVPRQEIMSLALWFSVAVVLAEVTTITSTLFRQVIGMLKRPWI